MNDDTLTKKALERNLWRYAWAKTFTKRVYFPIIAVMQVTVAGLTYDEIATVAIAAAVAQGILQIPTGYLADKFGDKKMMVLGALFMIPSTLFYIFLPNFYGSLFGLISYAGGLAFISGALESFVHDTLVSLGRADEYTKVVGRAQTFGLVGNVILVSLVPLTYAVDFRLSFVVGTLCSFGLLYVLATMVKPPFRRLIGKASSLEALRKIITWQNLALFLLAGFIGGVFERGADYTTLLFKGVGIPENHFGFIVAAASVVGAVVGWYLHVFDRMTPALFYIFDVVITALCFWALGQTQVTGIVVSVYILFLGYARVRFIVIQSKLLKTIQHTYKATLLSALGFFSLFGGILAVSLVSQLINSRGVFGGHNYFGYVIFAIGGVLWLLVIASLRLARKRLPQESD